MFGRDDDSLLRDLPSSLTNFSNPAATDNGRSELKSVHGNRRHIFTVWFVSLSALASLG